MTLELCANCGGPNKRTTSRPVNWCSRCKHEAWKARALERGYDFDAARDRKRNWVRKQYAVYDNIRLYITREEFDALFEKQQGACAICRSKESSFQRTGPRSLCIDHCHETGVIRGLLCARCNKGLGSLGDNLASLKKAVSYLEIAEQSNLVCRDIKGQVVSVAGLKEIHYADRPS